MRSSRTVVFLALALLLGAPRATHASDLEDTEAAAVRSVEGGVESAVALLRSSVDINSGTMNFAGVREVGRLFRARFEEVGFHVRWVDGTPWGRAGHLVARRPGAGSGPRILLIGHLDTVFEPDSPFQHFENLDDVHGAGPGVIDMKGGIVVMLLALGALADAGALDALSFTVVLTGDEEKPGHPLAAARADLRAAAEWADVAIGFEDGDGDPATAVISRRGFTGWTLRTRGRRAHSSRIFGEEYGSGAVFEAARILTAFRDRLRPEEYLTLNPGIIVGGTTADFDAEQARGNAFGKKNVIAEVAVVDGDLRTLSPDQLERASAEMRRIVSESLPHTTAEIAFDEGYPPLAPSAGNKRLLALFDEGSRRLGFGPVAAVDPSRAGAADVSFTAGLVGRAMDGVGLMGKGGHTVEEVADLRTLPVQAERVALLFLRLAEEPMVR